ncbi:hypothetical protein SC499_25110 [Peribacillus simplex]|uniref:hypothetical protein n=1 Tax=Peribacillus simplex TaxID=1478 RepID=UPI00298DCA90|nr:hypothetical protein [Peribacillus simplex]MDW7617857.1 hypothetical protein [Peribacillus simplex]
MDTKTLEKFVTMPNTAGMAISLATLTIVILFVLLDLQYIQRLGEYIVLLDITNSSTQHHFRKHGYLVNMVEGIVFSQPFKSPSYG